MDQVAKKTNDDALKIFKKAIENVKPLLEVKTRRVGGANYQVPVEVNPFRRQSLAIRWLLQYSRERAGKTMVDKLADELIDAANSRGGAMKKKEDVHRMRKRQGVRALPLVKGVFVSEAVAIRSGEKKGAQGAMGRAFKLEDTRNIGIMAHIDAGKTTSRSASCSIRV